MALRKRTVTIFFVTVERVTMSGLPSNRKLAFVAERVWNTLPVGSFQMVEACLIRRTSES